MHAGLLRGRTEARPPPLAWGPSYSGACQRRHLPELAACGKVHLPPGVRLQRKWRDSRFGLHPAVGRPGELFPANLLPAAGADSPRTLRPLPAGGNMPGDASRGAEAARNIQEDGRPRRKSQCPEGRMGIHRPRRQPGDKCRRPRSLRILTQKDRAACRKTWRTPPRAGRGSGEPLQETPPQML